MYAQLGTIIFDNLKSPSEFEQKSAVGYAEHALIDGKPRIQRVGTDLERITLTLKLHHTFCDVQGEIDALHDAMNASEVLPLITGYGMYVGNFVIASMSRTITHASPNGFLISASVEVSLTEFTEGDKLANLAQSAIQAGFAMLNNTPGTVIASTPIQSVPASISADLEAVSLESSAITQDLSDASAPADRVRLLNRVVERTQEIQARVTKATSTIGSAGAQIQSKAQAVMATFRNLERSAIKVREAASIQDYSDALAANQSLINANNSTISAGATIAALTAIRR